MIPSRQGAVMAQLRRIFYCRINLAMTLIAYSPPYCRHKLRSGSFPQRFPHLVEILLLAFRGGTRDDGPRHLTRRQGVLAIIPPIRETYMLADFEIWPAWQFIACIAALGVIGTLAVGNRRLRRQKLQLIAALDHMSQGLCMYDGTERLLLYNKRYMEIYGFSPEVVKPGCSLRDVLRYRV